MSPKMLIPPLIVVVGETASGKSALALDLAEIFNGALICADSRTVYRGMDIGTAKPSIKDTQKVQHYCVDLVNPDQRFTVADFKAHALTAIEKITAAGKVPILVGGTGLYIDAVIYDFAFRGPADQDMREEVSALSVEELQARLEQRGIEVPPNSRNPRHLIRALESGGVVKQQSELRPNCLVIGLETPVDDRQNRIADRLRHMIASGLEGEVRNLVTKYTWGVSPLQTIGYQEWRPYFDNTQSLEETVELINKNTLRYAKRQRTWFRRNKSIHWHNIGDETTKIVDLVTTLLNK